VVTAGPVAVCGGEVSSVKVIDPAANVHPARLETTFAMAVNGAGSVSVTGVTVTVVVVAGPRVRVLPPLLGPQLGLPAKEARIRKIAPLLPEGAANVAVATPLAPVVTGRLVTGGELCSVKVTGCPDVQALVLEDSVAEAVNDEPGAAVTLATVSDVVAVAEVPGTVTSAVPTAGPQGKVPPA